MFLILRTAKLRRQSPSFLSIGIETFFPDWTYGLILTCTHLRFRILLIAYFTIAGNIFGA
jgi:hypothetical protein